MTPLVDVYIVRIAFIRVLRYDGIDGVGGCKWLCFSGDSGTAPCGSGPSAHRYDAQSQAQRKRVMKRIVVFCDGAG